LAARASRVVEIRDGRIASDQATRPGNGAAPSGRIAGPAPIIATPEPVL
jgi:hypothetical protein